MTSHARIPGLDGLRAIACLAVFAVHLQQLTGLRGKLGPIDFQRLLENGNTGVCLFFMLSGFLLSLPFWIKEPHDDITHQHRGSRWLLGFALRRIGRIIPAYYLCLTALIFMGRAQSTNDIVMHYAFIHNFSDATIYSINDPFWTIAVQAQFYLVFAMLMLVLAPLSRQRGIVAIGLIVGIIAAYFAHHALFNAASSGRGLQMFKNASSVVRVSTLAHLPHFMLGMLAAVVYASFNSSPAQGQAAGGLSEQKETQRRLTTRPSLSTDIPSRQGSRSSTASTAFASNNTSLGFDFIVFLLIVATFCILALPWLDNALRLPSGAKEDAMIGRYNFPYIPLLIAMLLILVPRTRFISKLLEFAPLRGIGVISYGIYVFHLPCLEMCKRLLTGGRGGAVPNWIALAAIGFAVTLIVAGLSYFLIEQPILRWVRKRK